MPAITAFGSLFSNEESYVAAVAAATGLTVVTDADLARDAAAKSGIDQSKILRAFQSQASVFNKFSHEKERATAWLKLALAERLAAREKVLMHGMCAVFPPKAITHVLRLCLVADVKYRAAVGAARDMGEKDAQRLIQKDYEDRAAWVRSVWGLDDPWSPSLFDIIVPTDKKTPEEVAAMVAEYLGRPALAENDASLQATADFLLAARVETVLAAKGHQVGVTAYHGKVLITINKNVLLLDRLEQELKSIAAKVEGVLGVETKVGRDFHKTDIYRRVNFEMPSRVLLVDDERDFVETLSERLSMRDMGSHVVYDGESALDLVAEDEPDVMVLDLKMPGIDGIEVLRRVKQERPGVEVIILTGHGTETDRQTCMELGAFAYLQKPVDIDELSRVLKAAHEKIRNRKS